MPGGSEVPGYYPREEERTGYRVVRDTDTLGASYDRYLRNGVLIVTLFFPPSITCGFNMEIIL